MRLAILMSIKEVLSPPGEMSTSDRELCISGETPCSAQHHSPIFHAPQKVIFYALRCGIPGKPHTNCSHAEAEESNGPSSMELEVEGQKN